MAQQWDIIGRHKLKGFKNSPWVMVKRRVKIRKAKNLWDCYWFNTQTRIFTKYMAEPSYKRAIGTKGQESASSLLLERDSGDIWACPRRSLRFFRGVGQMELFQKHRG